MFVTHKSESCHVTYEQMVTEHTVEGGGDPHGTGDVLQIQLVDRLSRSMRHVTHICNPVGMCHVTLPMSKW